MQIIEIVIFSPAILVGYLYYKVQLYFKVGMEVGKL